MGISRPDGFIYRFISGFANLVLLSLCWLVCCIPLVTIGASCSALFSVCFKMTKDEDGHIVRQFFAAFRGNFRYSGRGICISLVCGTYRALRISLLL